VGRCSAEFFFMLLPVFFGNAIGFLREFFERSSVVTEAAPKRSRRRSKENRDKDQAKPLNNCRRDLQPLAGHLTFNVPTNITP